MVTPELVAAVAATIAAVLSGVAIWIGGAREERKCRRDALVDTLGRFSTPVSLARARCYGPNAAVTSLPERIGECRVGAPVLDNRPDAVTGVGDSQRGRTRGAPAYGRRRGL
jgi:hypothetical protein